MSAYQRKPISAVAHCEVAGCRWVRIYYERYQPMPPAARHWTPERRAEQALLTHCRRSHRPKVLINGR